MPCTNGTMTYIVHGATGAQGAPVLAALTAAGHSAAAAVRDVSRVSGAPAVGIDNEDPDSLAAAYRGAAGVFVHLPLGSPDQQMAYARAIAAAVERARPARVVVSTSGYPFGAAGAPTPLDVLIDGLGASGVSHAVLAPVMYLENLLLPPVVQGIRDDGVLRYPMRTDYAISWSSHLDVAQVALRLLTDDTTGVVRVGALPGQVGSDLAADFAAHLGREVVFESITPAAFGEMIIPLFGEAGSRPVIEAYAWRLGQPGDVVPEELSAQRRLGLSPRPVQTWLSDMAV